MLRGGPHVGPRDNSGFLPHRRHPAYRNSRRYRDLASFFLSRRARRHRHTPNCAQAMEPVQIATGSPPDRSTFDDSADSSPGVCVPCGKRFWRPTGPKDNGIGLKSLLLLALATPHPPGLPLEAEAPGHSPMPPGCPPHWSGLLLSDALLCGLEDC